MEGMAPSISRWNKSDKLAHVLYDIRGPVLAEAQRMEDEGHRILKLNIGNPAPFGFDAPEEIQQDFIHELPHAQGYSDSKGILSARRAVVQHYEERGVEGFDVDRVYLGNGVSELIVMAMSALLNNGDEVLIPSPDYPLWTAAVSLSGGTPRHYICDEANEWLPDLDHIRAKITPRTKTIVPVHLFGQCADMKPIMELAAKHTLFVIEDNCQAIGSDYVVENDAPRKAGTIGDIGVTSFFPSKNLGCYGDGGAIFTNDDETAKRLRQVCNHGSEVRYYHDVVGVNSRLDSMQAAVLRIKLRRLDEYGRARQQAAATYDEAFGGLEHVHVPERSADSSHVFHQYTLRITGGHRDALRAHLEKHGVPAMIYYPVPLHMQKAYEGYGIRKGDLPITERLMDEVLSLPMSTELDNEQLTHITNAVKSYFAT